MTTQVSRQLTGSELGGDLRDAAEALGLLARLLSMKAARVTEVDVEPEEEAPPSPRRGAGSPSTGSSGRPWRRSCWSPPRPASAASSAWSPPRSSPWSGCASPPTGSRPPSARCSSACRTPAPLPVGMVTFSVEEKVAWLLELLARGPLEFEAIFAEVTTRLEAVACFLALLELLKRGRAVVDQPEPFGPIRVRSE